jgi:YrbI family 3-deoxy-D-manno-octulosonate 8-phosphate phosphatase
MSIHVVIFDIDGVFTDGKVMVTEDGKELKQLSYSDIDAFFSIKREGFRTAFITGESTPISKWFKKRFKPHHFYSGCKDKVRAFRDIKKKEGSENSEICYIGDSPRDAPALKMAGLKICPKNASQDIKKICDRILPSMGGNGAVSDLLFLLRSLRKSNRHQ